MTSSLTHQDVFCRILVGYFNAVQLDCTSWEIPIQLGAAIREDIPYIPLKDDSGDNISELNPFFCELTAIYWAWKNYSKLGSPKYIGLEHYRRRFDVEGDISDFIGDFDIVAPQCDLSLLGEVSVKSQFEHHHPSSALELVVQYIKDFYPQYSEACESYLHEHIGYFFNMFIMRREIFFEYCDFLFGILLNIHPKLDYSTCSAYNIRTIGFLAERVTGIFLFYKSKFEKLKIKNVTVKCYEMTQNMPRELLPFSTLNFRQSIPIVCCTDDNYSPFVETMLVSLIENSNKLDFLDIYILVDKFSEDNANSLSLLSQKYQNCKISFVKVLDYIPKSVFLEIEKLKTSYPIITYFRLFIPTIFHKFKKVVWLDSDTIVLRDISELYSVDISKNFLAAVKDFEVMRLFNADETWYDYVKTYLNVSEPYKYFQAGVLLLNIEYCLQQNIVDKILDSFKNFSELRAADQDLLNHICQNNFILLPSNWNFEWHLCFQTSDLSKQMTQQDLLDYLHAKSNPYIIHYASKWKPWNEPNKSGAGLFWHYAAMTNQFGKVIKNLINFSNCENLDESLSLGNGNFGQLGEEANCRSLNRCNGSQISQEITRINNYYVYYLLDFRPQFSFSKRAFYIFMTKLKLGSIFSLSKKKRRVLARTYRECSRLNWNDRKSWYVIKFSKLFDSQWYLDTYSDVKASGMSAEFHFLRYGYLEGRNPSPFFNTTKYLQCNVDVKNSGMNPLVHFELFGRKEKRLVYGL